MNLNRALQEDSLIGVNWHFRDREVTFGRNDRGIPCYQNRLSDEEIGSALHSEWVGINFEERRVGHKPVVKAEATSSPSFSVHKAACLLSSDDILPSAFWVPKTVWLDALRSGKLTEISEALQDAMSSWADTHGEIIFPP